MTGGESGFWGRRRWRAEGLQDPHIGQGPLSTCLPCGPGEAEGKGAPHHSPALIFDFEERCLQLGYWKGNAHA